MKRLLINYGTALLFALYPLVLIVWHTLRHTGSSPTLPHIRIKLDQ